MDTDLEVLLSTSESHRIAFLLCTDQVSREIVEPALQIVTPTMMTTTITKTKIITNMLWKSEKNESKKSNCTA